MVEEKDEATTGETGCASADAAAVQSPDALHQAADIASPALAPARGTRAAMSEAGAPHGPENETDNDFNSELADEPAARGTRTRAKASADAGKVIIVPFGDRGPEREGGKRREMPGKRRFAALATLLALATGTGAFGGAFATATLFRGAETASTGSGAFDGSIARIDADLLALKASLEFGSKLGQSQFNKTSERLDKIEKAQAEPAAKLARLSEAVDRLRTAPASLSSAGAATPATAREITGSIASASPQATSKSEAPRNETAKSEAKTEVGKLPTVEGWVLRDVVHGGALIDGRRGMYEVYAGDTIPGLGRIDAVRRQDGRWVVVTSKGLIVAR